MKIAQTINCIGLSCPIPIMKLEKAFFNVDMDVIVEFLCTGYNTKLEVLAWCEKTNKKVSVSEDNQGVFRFLMEKKVNN